MIYNALTVNHNDVNDAEKPFRVSGAVDESSLSAFY